MKKNFWLIINSCNCIVLLHPQIKSADDQVQKDSFMKGAKKSVEAGVCLTPLVFNPYISVFYVFKHIFWIENTSKSLPPPHRAENQLNELEQRLAQTEKMLNSILTQLDPLTNWWVASLHVISVGVSVTPCVNIGFYLQVHSQLFSSMCVLDVQ